MIYCVADIHMDNRKQFPGEMRAGLNDRARRIAAALGQAMAVVTGDDEMVLLGDVFDTHRPSPALIRATQDALGTDRATVIVGNHDMASDEVGNNACAPLAPCAQVVEHEAELSHFEADNGAPGAALLVPFKAPVADGINAALDWAEKQADWRAAEVKLLMGHWGISCDSDPVFMREARDAISIDELYDLCAASDIQGCAAGNWHGRRDWKLDGCHILQVGALCPTGFDNPGWDGYGTVAWWSTQTVGWDWKELAGPRFIRHIPTVAELQKHRDNTVYVRVDVSPDDDFTVDEVSKKLQALPIQGFQVRPVPSTDAREAARSAAGGARSATTIGGALAAYVSKMPMPVGVDRKEVLAEASRFLQEA